MSDKTRMRIRYAVITLVLLILEVLIALFVHDKFVRPYIGDVLVVAVIYTFIRIWLPEKCRLLPIYVFLFAAGVEVLQYFNIVEVLGLGQNTFFRILIGSTFDVADVLCYGIGCLLLGGWEILQYRKCGKQKRKEPLK